ncbi:MAG: transcriptional regulator [Boseongicola sp.]|nr:MAG: transcriptional regulator [Boseongicola sp.]
MTKYGQFCPVAKSTEMLGNPWSLLIIREMLLGSTRFSTFQKGMPKISPTVLNTRLKELEANGLIVKRRLQGQRGHEYRLTPAGRELGPVVEGLTIWGMRWARSQMDDAEMDVTFLMFDIQRNLVTKALPDGQTVLCFNVGDLAQFDRWWMVIDGDAGGTVDLCHTDPGKDVDLYLTANARDLIEVWMGDQPLRGAMDAGRLELVGAKDLVRSFSKWFPLSAAAGVPRVTA